MISYLKGKIKIKADKYIILDVGHIGYQVFISPIILAKFKEGQEIELFTHLYSREDSQELYGFETKEELDFFAVLLSITGIGPKSALGVLAVAKLPDIKKAIMAEDPALLRQVSGIGQKTAERIVVELKNKIEEQDVGFGGASFSAAELEGLIGLGYSAKEAREALGKVSEKIEDPSQRLKEALKILGK